MYNEFIEYIDNALNEYGTLEIVCQDCCHPQHQ